MLLRLASIHTPRSNAPISVMIESKDFVNRYYHPSLASVNRMAKLFRERKTDHRVDAYPNAFHVMYFIWFK